MKKQRVKIGELNFELSAPEAGEVLKEGMEEFPMLEVENDASMVYVKMDKDQAINLRNLLDDFIHSNDPGQGIADEMG